MRATDELTAATAVYQAAVRAKAKEPLTVSKFVDLRNCRQDVNGTILNANELIGELKQKRPELFEQPAKFIPPKAPEPCTKDAFEMTDEEFENVWAGRFPWTK